MKKGGQDGYYLVVVRSCLLLFFVRFFFCLVGFLVGAFSFRIRTFFALPALDPQSVGAFLRFLLFGLYFPSLPFSSGLWDILERFPSQVSFLYQDFDPALVPSPSLASPIEFLSFILRKHMMFLFRYTMYDDPILLYAVQRLCPYVLLLLATFFFIAIASRLVEICTYTVYER